MSRAVLMLEFNELTPTLMDRFIAEGHLPAFERLRDRSATFVTDAGEIDERLNPWVQWVTVHTGATAEEHGIGKLGESQRLTLPTIADVVSDAGRAVWLCGSMNVAPVGPVNGCVLPDPWAVDATPQPRELEPFFRFVAANVQEHTSEQQPLSRRDATAFVAFLVRHGLSSSTAVATMRQLLGERTGRVGRWERAELLDRFQWDVFRHYYRRVEPAFATFFSNSTAHFQHLHWDELDGDAERSAVLHGYRHMDRLVDRAMSLAGPDRTVLLCTALSQVANRDATVYDGFYRPRRLDTLADELGLSGVREVSPVMAEQFHVLFESDDSARGGAHLLESARADGDQVFDARRRGNDVLVGCRFVTPRPSGQVIELAGGRAVVLSDVFYWTDAPRRGTHHADGILWVSGQSVREPCGRVPLESVAPTILSLLGLDQPRSMRSAPALVGACA